MPLTDTFLPLESIREEPQRVVYNRVAEEVGLEAAVGGRPALESSSLAQDDPATEGSKTSSESSSVEVLTRPVRRLQS